MDLGSSAWNQSAGKQNKRLARKNYERKKLQAASSKLQAWQPVPEMIGWTLIHYGHWIYPEEEVMDQGQWPNGNYAEWLSHYKYWVLPTGP